MKTARLQNASLGEKIAAKRAGRLATTPESAKGHFVAAGWENARLDEPSKRSVWSASGCRSRRTCPLSSGTGTAGGEQGSRQPGSGAKGTLVAANLNSKKSRIDFSLSKILIARHEFITGKSIIKTIASRRRPKG